MHMRMRMHLHMHNAYVCRLIVLGKGEEAGYLMIERSPAPHTCLDPDAFAREIAGIIAQARKFDFFLSKISVGALLSDLFAASRTHHVKLDSDFVSIIIGVIVLEGLGRSLDPNCNVLAPALEIIAKQQVRGLLRKFKPPRSNTYSNLYNSA
jgi:predicted unusual protein kinase regulating ubiquinone biosynthesis (AarF/ABC1/UbiB family)